MPGVNKLICFLHSPRIHGIGVNAILINPLCFSRTLRPIVSIYRLRRGEKMSQVARSIFVTLVNQNILIIDLI